MILLLCLAFALVLFLVMHYLEYRHELEAVRELTRLDTAQKKLGDALQSALDDAAVALVEALATKRELRQMTDALTETQHDARTARGHTTGLLETFNDTWRRFDDQLAAHLRSHVVSVGDAVDQAIELAEQEWGDEGRGADGQQCRNCRFRGTKDELMAHAGAAGHAAIF